MHNEARIDYIDHARGILISLVVLGHLLPAGLIKGIICVFHVPAFFIISGMLFAYSSLPHKPIGEVIVKKIKTLLIPYLFFEAVYTAWACVFGGGNLPQMISNTFCFNSNVGSLWYLYTLFFSELLFCLIQKMFDSKTIKIVIPCVLATAVFFCDRLNWQILIGRVFIGLLFITVGFYAGKLFSGEIPKKQNNVYIVLGAILVVIIGRYNGIVDLWSLDFGNPIMYIGGSLIGTYVVIQVSKTRVSQKITFLGKNSLIILGTHKILIELIGYLTGRESFNTFSAIAAFLFIIVAEVPVIILCNKFVPTLVGKSKKTAMCS